VHFDAVLSELLFMERLNEIATVIPLRKGL